MNLISALLRYISLAALLLGGVVPLALKAQPVDQEILEVAMVVRFLPFVEWPEESDNPLNRKLIIGVFDDEDMFDAFQSLFEDESFGSRFAVRNVKVGEVEIFDELDALFFSGWNQNDVSDTIRRVGTRPIVLLGSFEGFLEYGGMVNFIKRQNRLKFEIHNGHAKKNGIRFRAKLLRLAERVFER